MAVMPSSAKVAAPGVQAEQSRAKKTKLQGKPKKGVPANSAANHE
jgi:hypothetical protein